MSLTHSQPPFPSEAIAREMVRKELAWVQTNVFNSKGESTNTSVTLKDITDVQVFSTTAPGGNVGPRNGQRKGKLMTIMTQVTDLEYVNSSATISESSDHSILHDAPN
jgi:hypothetical protein